MLKLCRHKFWICFAAAALVPAGLAELGPEPRYVNSSRITLMARIDGGATVVMTQLWVSTDLGKTWVIDDQEHRDPTRIVYDAPRDGRYDFFIVASNAAGSSAEAPGNGTAPQGSVIVDTRVPTVQLHRVFPHRSTEFRPSLRLELSLIEENLSDDGVRVFYRESGSKSWRDGGPIRAADREMDWELPDDIASMIDVGVLVIDRAGNRTLESLYNVDVAFARKDIDELSYLEPTEPVDQKHPQPEPAQKKLVQSESDPATMQRVETLRRLADRYLGRGKTDLALARLRDAIELAPEDADLHVRLGEVLFRSRRANDAGTEFAEALALQPEHLGALDGLALVDFSRQDFDKARQRLKAILELEPQAGKTWLHLGDVENRMGERVEALEAWKKVFGLTNERDPLRRRVEERLRAFEPARNTRGNN